MRTYIVVPNDCLLIALLVEGIKNNFLCGVPQADRKAYMEIQHIS